MNQATAQAASQGKMQEIQVQTQARIAEIQAKAEADASLLQLEYQLKGFLETTKGNTNALVRKEEKDFRKELEEFKEDRKDKRVKDQAVEQSKMISQRQGKRDELEDDSDLADVLTS